jgi:hypothetical protein
VKVEVATHVVKVEEEAAVTPVTKVEVVEKK